MKRKIEADARRRAPKCIGAYEQHQEIGRGTYGTVYAGVRRQSGARHTGDARSTTTTSSEEPRGGGEDQRVAIKKVLGRIDTGKREATFLQRCRGASHVVQLLDVVERNDKLYLVLEYMESDLETILSATDAVPTLPIAHVKTYLRMLLAGVQELHARNILHRDLKPNNLLLSSTQHTAKITDFGMATDIAMAPAPAAGSDSPQPHDAPETETATESGASKATPSPVKRSIQVVTRAYRAPELFFGCDSYGTEVDVWSIGCIFGELLLRKPLFDGASDIDQLSQIFELLGSPSENGWDAAATLPFYLRFKDTKPRPLCERFCSELSSAGVELLREMLALDPKKRISIDDALAHAFFQEAPLPVDACELVIPEDPQRSVRSVDARDGEASVKGRRLL